MVYDYAITGGGIVGLATAYQLARQYPGARILVIEKDPELAAHQTGRNSGVIHSGIYYAPGSLKARFARAGCRGMVEFAQEHGIPHQVTGKVIVATSEAELPRLDKLLDRGQANGIPCERIGPERLREIEPHVAGIAAIHVHSTGIIHYGTVTQKLAQLFGGDLMLGTRVLHQRDEGPHVVIETTGGPHRAKRVINCAGLHADRLAQRAGAEPPARIVPFRGEYYELIPERRHLVRTLIYPVPNPAFPFLGVHFTKMIDGSVHAGPNAVLAWKREGYFKSSIDARDLLETLAYPGFWKLALQHAGEGGKEIVRSLLKPVFVASLQQLVPEVRGQDLTVCKAGVRAQAVTPAGKLLDDFAILKQGRILHILNAVSPAATASLEIGRYIAEQLDHP
jgi:L-2-hydroxyglutarate oxidase